MQWLSLVNEDGGVQRLKLANRKPAVTPGVDPVSPYPSTHAARIGEGARQQQQPPRNERRRQDRRKGGDRRQKQEPVLLDTRTRHDRRQIENRRQSAAGEKIPKALTRLNLYV